MGGSKTTNSSSTAIPAEIRERGTKITNAAMGTYFDPAKNYQTYDPSKYAGVGEATTGQLNNYHTQAGSDIGQAGNQVGQATGAFQQAGQSYQPYFGRADNTMTAASGNTAGTVSGPNFTSENLQRFQNPYQQNVIDVGVRQIMDNMTQGRLQNQSRAALAGAFGGSRHGVIDAMGQQNAMQTMSDFVGSQLASGYDKAVNQYNTDFSQGVQAQQLNNQAAGQNFNQGWQTANFLKDLGKSNLDAGIATGDAMLRGAQGNMQVADANMKLGNIYTAQDEAEKTNAYEKGYLDKRNYPMDVYERLAAMNAMQPVNRTTTGTQKTSGGWLGPALGAVGSLMGSDERIKEDVHERNPEDALKAFGKMGAFTYSYKDEAKRAHPELTAEGERRGFMAQDYEKHFKRPAGPTMADGTKTVDIPNLLGDVVNAITALEKRTRKLKGAA